MGVGSILTGAALAGVGVAATKKLIQLNITSCYGMSLPHVIVAVSVHNIVFEILEAIKTKCFAEESKGKEYFSLLQHTVSVLSGAISVFAITPLTATVVASVVVALFMQTMQAACEEKVLSRLAAGRISKFGEEMFQLVKTRVGFAR